MVAIVVSALIGLIVGMMFSAPIWNWIKGTAKKVENAVEKNQNAKP